jgi:hypothetical protein
MKSSDKREALFVEAFGFVLGLKVLRSDVFCIDSCDAFACAFALRLSSHLCLADSDRNLLN